MPPLIGDNNTTTVVGDALEQQLNTVVVEAILEVSDSEVWIVERVSGGITNQLFRVVLNDGSTTGTLPSSVLIGTDLWRPQDD